LIPSVRGAPRYSNPSAKGKRKTISNEIVTLTHCLNWTETAGSEKRRGQAKELRAENFNAVAPAWGYFTDLRDRPKRTKGWSKGGGGG